MPSRSRPGPNFCSGFCVAARLAEAATRFAACFQKEQAATCGIYLAVGASLGARVRTIILTIGLRNSVTLSSLAIRWKPGGLQRGYSNEQPRTQISRAVEIGVRRACPRHA